MSTVELMEKVTSQIRVCVQCPLSRKRKSAVPGEGDTEASVVFVGEAPGRLEDMKGRPFVGAAGKILDGLLESIGLLRENIFITNVVKCRPPGNREPKSVEIGTCTSLYLKPQIKLIKPKVVVTLGRHSTQYVFSEAGIGKIKSITELRGKIRKVKFLSIPLLVLPMYHPASVLHNPRYREALESDFQLLKKELKKRRIA